MAPLRHFARLLQGQRPLLAGDPFVGVKDIAVEEPSRKGLTTTDRMRLKSAVDQRIAACKRENQNPYLGSSRILLVALYRRAALGVGFAQYRPV